eukprot:TRINITY_DN60520_c0_g1_i1.p1 TRINITY_DN60520_c0_g1~~TRINITY_DN60520_c0_g1_i1.p1  ORF type:complete len:634 (+),score=165.45 TRINITY_DN60520_c0_g1_i1:93-1994(+)
MADAGEDAELQRAKAQNERLRREWTRLRQEWQGLVQDNSQLCAAAGAAVRSLEQASQMSFAPDRSKAECPLTGGATAPPPPASDQGGALQPLSDLPPFGDAEIFFGSKPVYLAPVPGRVIPYIHGQWGAAISEAAVRIARSRAGSCPDLGPELADVRIPAIPAVDIVCGVPDADTSAVVEQWPEVLRRPLLKVAPGTDGVLPLAAVASGVRSCIVHVDGMWYRLKGSGNNDEGFIIRQHPKGADGPWREIRGSAFMHTAARELFMTSHLDSHLAAQGIPGANRALGIYEYGPPNAPLGMVLPPVCIVEQTFGERRFGSHICSGLELLLPLLVDESRLDVSALMERFPQGRPGRDQLDTLVDTAALMTDRMMAFEMDLGTHGLTWGDIPRDETCLADIAKHPLPLRAPTAVPSQWTEQGERPMSTRWLPAWRAACHRVAAGAGNGHALAYLYSRCGVECGELLRLMHQARVSWGTYQDGLTRSDLAQWHCNAHANNMVLLCEGSLQGRFLSYLDLDMAFDDSTFLDPTDPEAPPGAPPEKHDKLLRREEVNFLETLCGADSSTGVPQVAKRVVEAQGHAMRALRSALYDTLALGFMRGYTQDPRFPAAPYDEELHGTAYAIARLAVIVMADFVA